MRRVACLLAVVAAVAACSSGSGNSAATTSSASTTTSSAPASTTSTVPTTTVPPFNCTATVGDSNGTLASQGVVRKYLLEVPAGLTAPAPLVLNLHGYGSNAVEQAFYSSLPKEGAARGVIVVTPDGQGAREHWDFLPPPRGETNDYTFLGALLDSLEATGCVDKNREYADGISNGAAMSSFLACAFNARLAAVAPVSGTAQPIGCKAGDTIPLLAFHGTADPLVPYSGGTIDSGGASGGLPVKGVEEAVGDWAKQDGCGAAPTDTTIAADVTEIDYPGCPTGLNVTLYKIIGGGHTWPGAPVPVERLGPTTRSIDAAKLMLDFFAAHTLSGRQA